jgi:hypothetical protein
VLNSTPRHTPPCHAEADVRREHRHRPHIHHASDPGRSGPGGPGTFPRADPSAEMRPGAANEKRELGAGVLSAVRTTFEELVVDEVAPKSGHIVVIACEAAVELGFCHHLAGREGIGDDVSQESSTIDGLGGVSIDPSLGRQKSIHSDPLDGSRCGSKDFREGLARDIPAALLFDEAALEQGKNRVPMA